MKYPQILLVIALAIVTTLATAHFANTRAMQGEEVNPSSIKETSYERVMRTKTLRCGYEFWDSGIMRDAQTDQLYGEWVDFLNEIGKVSGLKVEWSAHVGWGDAVTALKGGKIDAMCAGIWQSAEKAKQIYFSIPLAYQSIEAFVQPDDHRFDNNIERINSDDVTIMVVDADTSDFLAREDFPKAKRIALGDLNGTDSDLYMGLATKKADVVFDTVGLWRQYDKANPGKVRRAAPGHNLRVFGLSIVTDNDDPRLMGMIDVGVQEIINSGAVDRILKKDEAKYPDMYLKSVKPYAE
jgi:ABC-type amino acid transport substrate-binding protein